MGAIETSLFISIFFQIITFLLNIYSLFITTSKPLLNKLLSLELLVQFIEGSFYFYWYKNFNDIKNVTPFRYVDWAFSTPAMLITLILYISNPDEKSNISWLSIITKDVSWISLVLLLNWLMLYIGYLGETKSISIYLAVFLGFIPFVIYFGIIYINYVLVFNKGYDLF